MLTELVRSQAHLARDEPTTQDVVAPPPPPGPAETLIGAVKELASVLKASFRNLIDDSTMPTFATFPGNIWDGTRNLFITGTLACGVWHRGDDIHLVCLTADRADTFWAVVQEELRLGKDFKTPKEHNIELSSDKQFARQNLHSIVGKIVRLCEINKVWQSTKFLATTDNKIVQDASSLPEQGRLPQRIHKERRNRSSYKRQPCSRQNERHGIHVTRPQRSAL